MQQTIKVIRIVGMQWLLLFLLLVLTACGGEEVNTDELPSMTLEELAAFDGQDGNPAYIAIDGLVYDVTKVREWAGGMHADAFTAGQDHTDALAGAPHTATKLNLAPVVAKIGE